MRRFAIAVLVAHFLIVFALLFHHFATRRISRKGPILVRTISFAPQIDHSQSIESPRVSALPPSSVKRVEKKKPGKEVVKTQGKGELLEQKLLKEISQSLGSIGTSADLPRPKKAISLPSYVEKKATIEEESLCDPSYSDALVGYLQEILDLPEYGDVKARLTINAAGRLTQCEILEQASGKNGDFLKKRLPELAYPCFNDFGIADASLTFTVVFRNAENH